MCQPVGLISGSSSGYAGQPWMRGMKNNYSVCIALGFVELATPHVSPKNGGPSPPAVS